MNVVQVPPFYTLGKKLWADSLWVLDQQSGSFSENIYNHLDEKHSTHYWVLFGNIANFKNS